MFRKMKRLVIFAPILVVLLCVGAATGVIPAVRNQFEPFFRESTMAHVEEPLASLLPREEPPAVSEEDTRKQTRMHELDAKSLRGEQLTEAEAAERWNLFRDHLSPADKLKIARLHKVEQMPRTDYPDYYPIPADDKEWSEAWSLHGEAQWDFVTSSGFGFRRMFLMRYETGRGGSTAHRDIDRVELVSLLTSSEPNAYVIDDMATPRIAKAAKRRSLDAFEAAALGAIQQGQNLVYSPIVPTRMFGAIRADESCLRCHSDKREGELLGAFTYWLKQPADQLKPSP